MCVSTHQSRWTLFGLAYQMHRLLALFLLQDGRKVGLPFQCLNGIVNGLASLVSSAKGIVRYVFHFCNFGNTSLRTLPFKDDRGRFVSPARFCVNPPAIFRLVIAIKIDAVYSVFRWAWSHVTHKFRWVILPLAAHRNPTSSVSWISMVFFIVASSLSTCPCPVFSSLSVSRKPMSSRSFYEGFDLQAPTTARSVKYNVPSIDSFFSPARTYAFPKRITMPIGEAFRYSQTPKLFTCDIIQYSHVAIILNARVVVNRIQLV